MALGVTEPKLYSPSALVPLGASKLLKMLLILTIKKIINVRSRD